MMSSSRRRQRRSVFASLAKTPQLGERSLSNMRVRREKDIIPSIEQRKRRATSAKAENPLSKRRPT